MIRKQIYIEERHERLLKYRASQRGVAAGRKAISFMRSLARRSRKAPAGRDWTRESLYDERIGRWQKA